MNRNSPKHVSLVVVPAAIRITQGTIFTCGLAEEYTDCRVHGLIITARCDLEHEKVRVFNYLPIVKLDDWLHRDGKEILVGRFESRIIGEMRSALKRQDFSVSILETETPRKILETLFPGGNRTADKLRGHFAELCERYDLSQQALAGNSSSATCAHIASLAPDLRDSLISELVRQRLASYYFLSRVDPLGDDEGYVILLREIRGMYPLIAEHLAQGVDATQFTTLCTIDARAATNLRIGANEYALPVGMLSSPHLEHLMQSFAMLFSRIGVPDPDTSYISSLWGRQRSLQGGEAQ